MILTIIISFFISFVNWIVLLEIITCWKHYPGSRSEQYLFLILLLIFNILSFFFLKFLSKKIKSVSRIFLATFLGFCSTLALHDITNNQKSENLSKEFSILIITIFYFSYLFFLRLKKTKNDLTTTNKYK